MTRAALAVLLCFAIQPGSQPPRPRLTGVAHMAISVSDIGKSRAFYHDWLGFAEPYDLKNTDGSLNMTFFKVNEDQYIEIFPVLQSFRDRLNHSAGAAGGAAGRRAGRGARGGGGPAAGGGGRGGN